MPGVGMIGLAIFGAAILATALLSAPALAQDAAIAGLPMPQTLITQPVDETQLTRLKGNTHPLARPQNDLGTAPATLPMERMLLVLKRSDAQEHALRTLLDDQQDKFSPNYHQWLAPEQFGKAFGPSDGDMQTIMGWLQSHGFQVAAPAKGRTVIEFSGSASQVQAAFHTTIHKYLVNGEQHWANASDPSIPSALTPVVAGVRSLHNFPGKAFHHDLGVFTRSKETGEVKPVHPLFTFPGSNCGVQGTTCYGVGPADFATIYDVLPLWNATPTVIDGTGQTIAIVAETEINPQDVTDFRNFFGMPAPNLQIIHNGPSPGFVSDETESDLDVQWSGGVAKGATIDFVVSATTDSTLGVDLSAQYIVDNNLAPVLSMSYGLCELATGTAGNQFYSQLWQQASAQGITAMVSSGDNGAAGCDPHGAPPPSPAQFGLEVTGWGDTPYNVSVGGTDFFDLTNQATYWNPTNASTTQASAKGPIPEATWNNSCTNSVFGDLLGFSNNAEANCNNSQLGGFIVTDGGSGGFSNCTSNDNQTVASCSGGYPRPSWQTETLPDGKRDIPDVSLFAAAGSPSGSFYIICEVDAVQSGSSCNPTDPNGTNFFAIGGTSASAPAFAGIMAMVNQQMALLGKSSRQGNANYVLYQMATQQPTAFHDVTQGTIRMPCVTGSPNCNTSTGGDQLGVLAGYDAGTGYDLATGLGSVDADVLVTKWSSVTGSFRATKTTLGLAQTTGIAHGASDTVTITVAPSSGTGTPTGNVSLIATVGVAPPNGTNTTGVQLQSFALTSGTNQGMISVPTKSLPGGSYNVTAHYPGDGTFAASDSAAVAVKVNPENSTTTLTAQTFSLSGTTVSVVPLGAGTSYGNLVYLQADVSGASKNGFPTGTVTFTDAGGPAIPGNPYPLDGGSTSNPGVSTAATPQGLFTLPVGSYSVTANYSHDASFNASPSTPLAFSISPAATTLTVTPSATTVAVGGSLMLTASITTGTPTVPSFGAAPTGTVSFFSNAQLVGTAQPVTGTAGSGTFSGVISGLGINPSSATASVTTTASPPTLPSGADLITATYTGDANYANSLTNTPVTVNVQADFSLPNGGLGTVNVASPGGMGTVNLSLTPGTGFNSAVTFTCVPATLPAETTCTQGMIAAGSTTGTMTVQTTGPHTVALMSGQRQNYVAVLAMGGGLALGGVFLVGGTRRRRWMVLMSLVVLALLITVPACGGGGGGGGTHMDPGTPVGMTTVTVTAAASGGSPSHTTTFVLNVQ